MRSRRPSPNSQLDPGVMISLLLAHQSETRRPEGLRLSGSSGLAASASSGALPPIELAFFSVSAAGQKFADRSATIRVASRIVSARTALFSHLVSSSSRSCPLALARRTHRVEIFRTRSMTPDFSPAEDGLSAGRVLFLETKDNGAAWLSGSRGWRNLFWRSEVVSESQAKRWEARAGRRATDWAKVLSSENRIGCRIGIVKV